MVAAPVSAQTKELVIWDTLFNIFPWNYAHNASDIIANKSTFVTVIANLG